MASSLKYGKIIFNMLRGKLHIKEIKQAYKVVEFVKSLKSLSLSLRQISKLDISDIKVAIKINNEYTTNPPITVMLIIDNLKAIIQKADESVTNLPEAKKSLDTILSVINIVDGVAKIIDAAK